MALTSPTGVSITNSTHNSITFTWTAGVDSTKTMIRYKKSEYPTSETDGTLGFHGTGSTATIYNLETNRTYYFSFFGTTESYSLSAVTDTDTTNLIPLGLAADGQYLYIAGAGTAGAVQIRDKSDLSVVDTLDVGGTAVTAERVSKVGRYLAYVYAAKGYLYDMSTKTVIIDFTATSYAGGADSMRSVAIDQEGEHVYYGNIDGTIYHYDIATLTQRTFKPATDYIRSIDAKDDLLVFGSNDNNAYVYDRSDRNNPTSITTLSGITSTIEVTRIHGDHIFVGGDQSNGTVNIYDKTTPYALVQTLGDTSNDITGICPVTGYMMISSDDENAYVYTGTPGTYSLTNTLADAGNDVEECCLCEDGSLYFCTGLAATEKLYSYTYLNFTYSGSPATTTATIDNSLTTPSTQNEKVIARHDFSTPNYWKDDGVLLYGAEEVPTGLRLNGTGSYFTWDSKDRLADLTSITFKMKFTPYFDYDSATVFFVHGGSNDLNILKYVTTNIMRVYIAGVKIVDIAAATWTQYWRSYQQNELVVSGVTGNTSVWLNGNAICSNDGSGWSNIDLSTLSFGIDSVGASLFKGIIHSFEIRDTLITNPAN